MSSTIPDTDIINQYLLDVNVPKDAHVPLEVFIAFPKTLTDLDVREKVVKQWLNGNDKQYVAMQLMFNREISLIFRPTGIMIDWVNITIATYTPSGLMIIVPTQFLRTLGANVEQQIENLNDYVFITLEKSEKFLIAKELVPLRGKIETDVAKEILDKTVLSPLEVMLTGLGYRLTPEVKRLFTPRLITWFKGFDGKPMHMAQFTLPETAKTHWSIRNETLLNWRYIPEPPTLARLILDARQGILGEVFLRNGISFDEFDKWDISNADRRMTFDAILTGMEQGKWCRGVSALGIRPPDVVRLIPIVFFGNLGDFAKLHGVMALCTRAWFTEVYSRRLTHDVSALADRLAIIDACFTKIPIMDAITNKVLPDSILRGIITILQNKVQKCDVSKLRGRLKRHADNLYAIMNTFCHVTPEDVDKIVAGTFEWDKQLPVTTTVTTEAPSRDITPQQQQIQPPQTLPSLDVTKAILEVITTACKTVPMVEKAYILQVLKKQYNIDLYAFNVAYNNLLQKGEITEPKEGYVKKV